MPAPDRRAPASGAGAGEERRVDHLIVGGGMTASAAVMGVLDRDPDATVALVGAEPHPPYERPPLSKDLWQEDEPDLDAIEHDRELFGGAELATGRRIVELRPEEHLAIDDRGARWRYRRVLLATGATPSVPPFGEGLAAVSTFRTRDDFVRLRARLAGGKRVTVVGGGFLGSELAAALRGAGAEVTMVFPERDVAARLLPAPWAARVTRRFRREGIDVRPGTLVDAIVPLHAGRDDGPVEVRSDDGEAWTADTVVVAVGVTPATELAEAAGLEVDDGIVVDDRFRTSAPDVLAAGDVARFPAPGLGPMRVEHEDHAKSGGLHAGRVMAGLDAPYDHLPMFYSDLFDLGYEAVGRCDASLETVLDGPAAADDADADVPGVAWYLADGRVVGALTWNAFGRLETARTLIRSGEPVDAAALRGRIGVGEG